MIRYDTTETWPLRRNINLASKRAVVINYTIRCDKLLCMGWEGKERKKKKNKHLLFKQASTGEEPKKEHPYWTGKILSHKGFITMPHVEEIHK